MTEEFYKKSDIKKLRKVRELTPDSFKAYVEFDKQALSEGALAQKIKRFIAIAVAHTTQCSFCIDFHTKEAKKLGQQSRKSLKPCGFLPHSAPEHR